MNSLSQNQPRSADVVIIGGGIAGITTAWYLNQAGLKVVVCEKGRVAGEQSSRNWGWIRQQGRDEAELPIVMESMRLWQEITDQLDEDVGYRREGSLYLCENDEEMARHDRFYSFAAAYGLRSARLNRSQLAALIVDCPARWQSALHTPSDGRAEPGLAVPAMARALAARGVIILENCAVLEIEQSNGRVTGVRTEQGLIEASTVQCSAGAWSTFLLQACSVRLPQLTVKASVARTAAVPPIFNGNASGSQIAFRRRLDGGYTVAATDRLEILPSTHHLRYLREFLPLMKLSMGKLKLRLPGLHASADYTRHRVLDPIPSAATVKRIADRLVDRLPQFRGIALVESWAGMIDALPDVVPVLDSVASIDGLWIATGFSGHGFGIGPAAGKIMAELIQNNAVEYDLSRFRLSRFSDGSKMVLGPAI